MSSFLSKLTKINLEELNKYNIYSFLLYDKDIIAYFYKESKKIDRFLFLVIGAIIGYSYIIVQYHYMLLILFLIPYFFPWYKSTIVKATISNEWKSVVDKLNRDFYGVVLTFYQISSPEMTASDLFYISYDLDDLDREIKIFVKYLVFQLEKGEPLNRALYSALEIFKGKRTEKFLSDILLASEEGNLYNYLKSTVYEEAEHARIRVKGYTSLLKAITTMIVALTVMLNVILFIVLAYTYGQLNKFQSIDTGTVLMGGFDIEGIMPKLPVKEILLFEAFALFPAIAFMMWFVNRVSRPLAS